MTFEPLSDRFVRNLERSLDRPIPASCFPATSAPPASSSALASSPAGRFLSDVPGKPLNWLWPGRIPLGHLTLLDASPGCGLSLFALTLAACVSSGSPLPEGTPTLPRCLPALIELAHQTNCAILLTRSLSQPPADPLRSSGPTSPLLEAARSRMVLTPDPGDERHRLLITTRHSLCAQPTILAYDILFSEADIPAIQWVDERDRSQLARLYTGPLYSLHRQAILSFLQNSASPRSIPEILEATCYDHEAGRKMLTRMKMAGELVSTARGLYTTTNHPSLTHLTNDPPPVPYVPNAAYTTSEVAQQQIDTSQ